jgi:hypothetical protein
MAASVTGEIPLKREQTNMQLHEEILKQGNFSLFLQLRSKDIMIKCSPTEVTKFTLHSMALLQNTCNVFFWITHSHLKRRGSKMSTE